MALSKATWLPSIDQTTELVGILLLFIPYIIILIPVLQSKIVKSLRALYLHHTPRDDWNPAVDQYPPRRLSGYLFTILWTFTSIWLLLIHNFTNTYWVDFIQYFIYLSLPLITSIIRPPSHHPCDISDLLIILLVMIPIEISQEVDVFLPDIEFSMYSSWGTSPNVSVLHLSAFNLFLFIFFILRPLDNIGLGFNLKKHSNITRCKWLSLRFIVIIFIFLFLAIPFCLIPSINYLHSSEKLNNIWIDGIGRYFALFFLEILTSEFLYRGIIQNLLHSALDFRYEARSYIRGHPDSIVSMLDHGTDNDSKQIELLSSSKRNRNEKRRPLVSVDSNGDADNTKYSNLDTYSDDKDDLSINTLYSVDTKRDTLCLNGFCYFLRFDHVRDWFVIILSSIIYAATIIDYRHFENTKDLIYGMILMFWFGFCCGWLYRLTKSCFVSAVLNSLVLFNFKYIFNPNTQFCNGAC